MQVDLRTTEEVEKTRCYKNYKPYRNVNERREARHQAVKRNGTFVSFTYRNEHESCPCGKQRKDHCMAGSAHARNQRVKRLKD